ncbi:hypothetical protein JP0114_07750 [Helicobacter pylori]
MKDARVQVMGIDAGGTMTDTFFVKENGSFVVGKAQSNPEDESLAIYNKLARRFIALEIRCE